MSEYFRYLVRSLILDDAIFDDPKIVILKDPVIDFLGRPLSANNIEVSEFTKETDSTMFLSELIVSVLDDDTFELKSKL